MWPNLSYQLSELTWPNPSDQIDLTQVTFHFFLESPKELFWDHSKCTDFYPPAIFEVPKVTVLWPLKWVFDKFWLLKRKKKIGHFCTEFQPLATNMYEQLKKISLWQILTFEKKKKNHMSLKKNKKNRQVSCTDFSAFTEFWT